jgi:hypothetical protein
MITNVADLDAALAWMRKVGYKKDFTCETWPLHVTHGGFDLVCNGPNGQWKIWANSPSYPQPHNFLIDALVAPWVAEALMDKQSKDRT